MKLFFLLSSIFVLTVAADKCSNNKKTVPGIYKARLEIKEICMNYTLRLLDGDIDTSLITANWIDESTGKSYSNVFGLSNPCTFPPNINQGDDFYFKIDSSGQIDCVVCMAYYPTPSRKLSIIIVEK